MNIKCFRIHVLWFTLALAISLILSLIEPVHFGVKPVAAQMARQVVTDPFNLRKLTSLKEFNDAIPGVSAAMGYEPKDTCSQQACLGLLSDWITTDNQFTVNLAHLSPADIAKQSGQGSRTDSLANWNFLADVTPRVLANAIADLKSSSLSKVPVLAAAASNRGISATSTVEEALQNQTIASSPLSALGVNLSDFAATDLGNFFNTPFDSYKDLALGKDVFKDFPIESILGLSDFPISVSFVGIPMRVDIVWGEAEQAGNPVNPKAQALDIAGSASEGGKTHRVPCGNGLNGPSEACPYIELTSLGKKTVSTFPIGSRWGASYIKDGVLIGAVDGGYGLLKPLARILGKVQEYRGINLSPLLSLWQRYNQRKGLKLRQYLW